MSETPTTSLRPSVVFCDVTVLLLAGWTVLCHAVVHAGGLPGHLRIGGIVLCIAIVGALVIGVRHLGARRVWALLSDDVPLPVARPRPEPRIGVRAALVAAGLCALWFTPGSVSFAIASTLVMAAGVWVNRGVSPAEGPTTIWQERSLWLLAFAIAAVALCTHRPDRDDAFYLGAATSVMKYPQLPLLSFDPIHGEGWPIQLAVYRSHTLEPLAGLLSGATGIGAVEFMHVGLTALGAVLWAFTMGRFTRHLLPTGWPFAVAAALLLYALEATRHQGYANFGIVRLFQGKAVFLSALVPLLFIYGMRFGRAPTSQRFVLLLAAQIAALGMTASALSVVPFVVAAAVLVGVADNPRPLKTLFMGAASTAYVLSTGLIFFLQMNAGGATARAASRAATTSTPASVGLSLLERAYQMVLGESGSEMLLLGAVLIAPGLAATASARRLSAVAGLVFFGVVANPWLTELLSRALFGKAAHWRIFWVLPLPLLVACAVASIGRHPLQRAVSVAALGIALHVLGGTHVLSKDNRVRLEAPGNHARPARWAVAEALVAAAPVGTRVLTDDRISQWIPAMSKRVHPVFVKASYLRGDDDLHRIGLSRCMAARSRGSCSVAFLRRELARYAPSAVAVRRNRHRAKLITALRASGYRRTGKVSGLQIWAAAAN